MYDLRPLRPDDAAWADLLARAFDRTPTAMHALLAYLHAWYPMVACGGWEDGRLVAAYSCLLRPLHVPGLPDPVTVGMSINMAVHPEHRGRGWVKRVAAPVYAQLAARGTAAGVGLSNAAGMRVDRHSNSYGYQVVGRLPVFVGRVPRSTQGDPLPHCASSLPPDLPVHHPDQIAFMHTGASLAHQVNNHPSRRYRVLWGPPGIIVDRPFTWNGITGPVLRAAYGPDLRVLLRSWLASLDGERLIRTMAAPHSTLIAALRELVPLVRLPVSREPYHLPAKPLGAPPDSLLDFSAWHCMTGDIL
ncbi:MAG: GNAT family N-acetyltransferase [Anaerolineae bacterium]